MSLASDICRDWMLLVNDGLEYVTVTARSQRGDVSNTTCANVPALAGAMNRKLQQLAGVAFDPRQVVWEIWNYRAVGSTTVETELGRKLRTGDRITTAGGQVFVIEAPMWSPQTNRWECLCTEEYS